MLIEWVLNIFLDDQKGFIREEELMQCMLYMWLPCSWSKNEFLLGRGFYNRVSGSAFFQIIWWTMRLLLVYLI